MKAEPYIMTKKPISSLGKMTVKIWHILCGTVKPDVKCWVGEVVYGEEKRRSGERWGERWGEKRGGEVRKRGEVRWGREERCKKEKGRRRKKKKKEEGGGRRREPTMSPLAVVDTWICWWFFSVFVK